MDFSPIRALVSIIPLSIALAALGCSGDAPAPKPPPEIFSDARLADVDEADLDRLRAFGGDEVIVDQDGDLHVYLTEANVTKPEEINAILPVVARLPQITHLYLTGTPVNDSGLDEVAKMESLKSINLDSSRITDAGLAKLASLPELKTVFCRKTEITVGGAAKLRDDNGVLVTR